MQSIKGIGFVSGERSIDTLKMECLRKECIESDFDIVGLAEVNKDWKSVRNENTIWNGTADLKKNRRIHISQNYNYPAKSEF